MRDIATNLDITERAAQRIVSELVEDGYLSRKRVGRRNEYKLHPKKPVPAPQTNETEVGELLDLLLSNQDPLE